MALDMGEVRKQIVADKEELTRKIAEKCAEEWSDLVEDSADNLSGVSEKAVTAAEQLEKYVGELQSALAECGRIGEAAKGMGERAAAMEESSKALAGDVDRIKAAVDDFVWEQKGVSKTAITQLNQSFEKIVEEIRFEGDAFSGELNSAGDRIRLAMENSAGEIQNYCREIAGNIQKYEDENGRGMQAAKNFRQELALLSGRIAALEAEVKKELDGFASDISQSSGRLAEFEGQLASGHEAMEKMMQSFDSVSRQTREALDGISQKAGEYMKCLEASCNAAEGLLQTRKEMDQLNEKKVKGRFYILAAMISAVMILQILGFFF